MLINLRSNQAYAPIFERQDRIIRLQGGAGSGKSIAVAQKILLHALQPQYFRAFVFRKVGRTVKDSVFQTFIDLISENNLQQIFRINKTLHEIVCTVTGNKIVCGGMDDPEKIKSIKDPTLIWMEEATEFSADDFKQLNLRLRKAGVLNQIVLSYNPINKDNWIYKNFEEQRREEYFLKTTHRDNMFLPQSYRDELNRLAGTDENYYNVYTLGEWGNNVEGLIFTGWKIVDELPAGEPIYGIDFGFNDPMTLVKCIIHEKDLYVDCLYYEREKTIPEMLGNFPAWGITRTTRGYCDSARPGDIQQIYNFGYVMFKPSIKGAGSIVSGINHLLTFNIHITSRSTELIRELNRYRWDTNKSGELVEGVPIDAFNHAIDAMRYAVYTHTYKPPAQSNIKRQPNPFLQKRIR